MSVEVFSIPSFGFCVFREANGSLRWQGNYKKMNVINAFPCDEGMHCIILLDMAASKKATFENLLCIDRAGRVVWKAKLPKSNDAFVSFQMEADGLLHANTWSGYRVTLDPLTGKLQQQKFVK